MLKDFPWDKRNVTKNPLFFFCELQLMTALLSILMRAETHGYLTKTVCRIFRFRLVFIKRCISVQKNHGLFDFKIS